MKLICIGDSLTYGYGISRRETWIALTAARTGMEIANAGICGDTTGGMLARFRSDVMEKRPKAVFMMGGANDMITGCPGFVPQSNLMSMVHQALSAGIFAMIGIPLPYWKEGIREDWAAFASGNLREEEAGAYRAWLLRLGETFGIPVVDFWTPFSELTRRGEAQDYYLDGLHPTREGHALMAQTMCEALTRTGLWHPSRI